MNAASLRLRLIVGLVCVWTLGAAAMAVFFYGQAVDPEEVMEVSSLASQARDLVGAVRWSPSGQFRAIDIPGRWRAAYGEPGAAFFTLFDPAGRAVARSQNLAAPLSEFPLESGRSVSSLRLIGPSQDLAAAARVRGGYRLIVARSNPSRVDETPAQQLQDFVPALIFAAAALIGLIAAALIAAWSLRPLKRAAREAAAIGPDSPVRLTIKRLPAEIRPLAQAINRALDRVSEAYGNEKRFTADAAHALRTPLAVLDLRLQRAQAEDRPDWPAVRSDVSELTRLVSGLLALARADRAGVFRERGEINLTRLVREAAAAIAPALERVGREIELDAPGPAVTIHGDAGELRELVVAVLENALVHGRGRILAELAPGEAGTVVLRVSDQGDGVAAAAREVVFERFHKLDAASGGAGLGLAIVRQTARGHGGEVRFLDGAVVEIVLRA